MTEENPAPAQPAHDAAPWTPPAPGHLAAMLPQYDEWVMIGCGGMGAVYRARQISLDRPVAIKVLPPLVGEDAAEFVQRFTNEARTMARLNHPAIVSVHDFGATPDGLLYFAMEYIDGTDVFKMVHAQKKLPPEHALSITAHVCDALAYAHEHGVIHRDIKPANILINMEGAVKVADFGLASMHDPAQAAGQQETGTIRGTPDYVAPEVLVIGATVDGRADLYAVGVMLYNMLTGDIPHHACKPASQKSGCDHRFDAIIRKATEHDVTQRYQSAREIRRDLDRILTVPVAKEQPVHRLHGGMPPRPIQHQPPPPKGIPWALLGAALIVLGGASLFLMKSGTSSAKTSPQHETVKSPPPKPLPGDPIPADKQPPAPARPTVVQAGASKGSPLSKLPVLSYAGHHYQIVEAEASFNEAQKHAESLGAHLLTITSQEEMNWLDQALPPLLKQAPQSMATIGGSRENGVWKWVTGEPFNYTRWDSSGPAPDSEPTKNFALKLTAQGAAAAWGYGLHNGRRAFILEWDGSPAGTPQPVATKPMPPPPPPVAESEGARRLRELDTQFHAALERDVLGPHRTALSDLNSKYTAAIDRSLATAAMNGPEALALREERQRIEKNGPLPADDPPSIPGILKTLRSTYRTSARPLDLARHNGIITVFLRYEEVLKTLEAEWTKASKIDDAKLAGTRLRNIGRERATLLNEAKELIPGGKELVLTKRDRFVSSETFQPPVEFTIVAKTDSRNLRLAYTARQVIFNWEVNPDDLRLDADPGGGRHAPGQGRLPEDTFVTIHWRIMPHMQSITVDGERRYLHFGDYSKVSKPLEIFPALASTVTVKSIKVSALDEQALTDRASSVPEMQELFVSRPNWTGEITIPPGTYQPFRRINIGAPGTRDPKAQNNEQRGDVTSQPGTRIENVRFHIQEGSWKAAGGMFRDVKISADLGGAFTASGCLFQDCAFAKEGGWYIAWHSSKWTFTDCVFTGSFLQNWKLGDVGMKLDACTFHNVDFISIGYKEDAGAEVKRDWLTIKNCRFVNCRVPESFALATQNCVFEKCTFGEPEEKLPVQSPLTAAIYLQDPVNQPKAGDGRTFTTLPAIQAPSGIGANVKHRLKGKVLDFE